jgi:hypothetical protein
MDLTRVRRTLRWLAAAALAAGAAACSDENPATFSDGAVILPATLKEALALADTIALDWNDGAYLAGLGGGFTVGDEEGRSRNHSFVYYARFGPTSLRKLTIDFINATPWTLETVVGSAPFPFPDRDFLDSDEVVGVCVDLAEMLNQNGQVIPDATNYAARLLSIPVWPEPGPQSSPSEIAWRVDFLVLTNGPQDTPVWYSVARMYVDPWNGQFLGQAVVPVQPELYRDLTPLP